MLLQVAASSCNTASVFSAASAASDAQAATDLAETQMDPIVGSWNGFRTAKGRTRMFRAAGTGVDGKDGGGEGGLRCCCTCSDRLCGSDATGDGGEPPGERIRTSLKTPFLGFVLGGSSSLKMLDLERDEQSGVCKLPSMLASGEVTAYAILSASLLEADARKLAKAFKPSSLLNRCAAIRSSTRSAMTSMMPLVQGEIVS